MSEPYHLVIKAHARRALEYQLAPSTAFAVWKFIAGPLVENPQRVGKQLVSPAPSVAFSVPVRGPFRRGPWFLTPPSVVRTTPEPGARGHIADGGSRPGRG